MTNLTGSGPTFVFLETLDFTVDELVKRFYRWYYRYTDGTVPIQNCPPYLGPRANAKDPPKRRDIAGQGEGVGGRYLR